MNVFFLIHLLTSYHLKFLICFRSNSTPKANSRGESYPSLIYSNPSLTPTKNKIKLEYISEGQPSPLKLDFGIELGLIHFKNDKVRCVSLSNLQHHSLARKALHRPNFT